MPVDVKYPHIEVQLTGQDGNAFSILARIEIELAKNDVSEDERNEFFREATESDYDHLLRTCMRWVTVL